MSEDAPRAMVTRGEKKPGNRYLRTPKAWAIRDSLDALLRQVVPCARAPRACTSVPSAAAGRAGLHRQASAPCVGEISQEDHRALADDLCCFMAGHASCTPGAHPSDERGRRGHGLQTVARAGTTLALERVFERNTGGAAHGRTRTSSPSRRTSCRPP
ncbi:hypothetical protein QJS66_02820 [Kocuria rhizophila]|nr:hypothetical protein QJS66_02820 [Kocuria rhizophila]